jgi:hypothetical protein
VSILLSKGEREYLLTRKEGKLKPLDKLPQKGRIAADQSRRDYKKNIRKKTKQAMKDLTLTFDTLTLSELNFYNEDYLNLFFPMFRIIQAKVHFTPRAYWKNRRLENLSYKLDLVDKSYDYKRLISDEKYRQRLIDWLLQSHPKVEDFPIDQKQIQEFFQEVTQDRILKVMEELTKSGLIPITLTQLVTKLEFKEGSGKVFLHNMLKQMELEGRVKIKKFKKEIFYTLN